MNTANAVTSGTNINQVASVGGKDITLAAGRDVTANAAVVAGTGDVNLAAGRNVRLGTVNENFPQQISWANDSAINLAAANNVNIVAGNRYAQVGSDVVVPKGDIDIAAKSVEIRAAEQASRTVTEDKHKQSGVTL